MIKHKNCLNDVVQSDKVYTMVSAKTFLPGLSYSKPCAAGRDSGLLRKADAEL